MAVNNTRPLEVAESFTCTPSSLLESTPCLKCLSEKELLAALVALFASKASKTVPEIMEDSACLNCMSEKQMLQAIVTIFGNYLLGEDTTPAEVIEEYRCLVCVPDHQLLAALLRLICTHFTTYTYTPQT